MNLNKLCSIVFSPEDKSPHQVKVNTKLSKVYKPIKINDFKKKFSIKHKLVPFNLSILYLSYLFEMSHLIFYVFYGIIIKMILKINLFVQWQYMQQLFDVFIKMFHSLYRSHFQVLRFFPCIVPVLSLRIVRNIAPISKSNIVPYIIPMFKFKHSLLHSCPF